MPPNEPQVGQPAPAFEALDDTGAPLSLDSLKGRWVVLYFYPKDDTPGCTIEACAFRDDFSQFEGLNVTIVGVSPDSVAKHVKFKEKFNLPFRLLADTDHAVATAYGVWQKKSMFGKKYMGVVRSTFLIDPNGRIAAIFPKVNPVGHAEEVRRAIAERAA